MSGLTKLFFIGFSFFFLLACKKKDQIDTPSKDMNNISYGSDSAMKMDVFLPQNRSYDSTKVMIYIHGGGWMSGDKSEFYSLKTNFESHLPNYAFVTINYRLCNGNPATNQFPTQEIDVKAAIDFVLSKRQEWQVSDQFVLAGGSAGGHLALLHAYKNNSDGLINAVAAYFPPTDLSSYYMNFTASQDMLNYVIGGSPDSLSLLYQESSPINYIETSIPTILFHGSNDVIVPVNQSYQLIDSLNAHLKVVESWIIPGEGHGFTASTFAESALRASDFFKEHNP